MEIRHLQIEFSFLLSAESSNAENHRTPFEVDALDRINTSGVATTIIQWCQVTPQYRISSQ
ncbi:MAG: hypothetical protein GY717_04740 [Rhodobacteraceae bacterium]|nr:hypothetical protein [Paracoccaceae bacterium]